jgi:hypothetical protein
MVQIRGIALNRDDRYAVCGFTDREDKRLAVSGLTGLENRGGDSALASGRGDIWNTLAFHARD